MNDVVEVLLQVAIAILLLVLLFFVICLYWLPFPNHFFPYLVHIEKHLRLPSSSGKLNRLGAGVDLHLGGDLHVHPLHLIHLLFPTLREVGSNFNT